MAVLIFIVLAAWSFFFSPLSALTSPVVSVSRTISRMVCCSEPPIYAERAGARGFELTDARTGARGLELTDARPSSFPNLNHAMSA